MVKQLKQFTESVSRVIQWLATWKGIILKVFNKAQVANVKQMIDVVAGELGWSVVDPKVII